MIRLPPLPSSIDRLEIFVVTHACGSSQDVFDGPSHSCGRFYTVCMSMLHARELTMIIDSVPLFRENLIVHAFLFLHLQTMEYDNLYFINA